VKAAVIGHPISHSLSPSIFKIIAEVEQSSLAYKTEDVLPENLDAFLQALKNDDDYVGVNVTIPHKENVLRSLDQVSDEVKAIGAANVIQAGPGKLIGFNTDVIGILSTLSDQEFHPAEKAAILIGAGGSARAVAYVLAHEKVKAIFVYNPRSDRGETLCESMQQHFPHVAFRSIRNLNQAIETPLDLIVNCTPIGMKGESIDFFLECKTLKFSPNALAFDLLYTPKQLPFLKVMKSLGVKTVDGLQMLIDQALATWELWIGKLHHKADLRVRLFKTLTGILKSRENPNPLFLAGFMGIGKSTIARELSYALNRNLLDTDKWIEEHAKLTIPEIFASEGEGAFRAHEREAIASFSQSGHSVIALGGGALNDESNLKQVLASGTLIYLKATPATLYKRLRRRTQHRPLLADLNDLELKEKISELLKKRIPIYERAHLHVEINADDTPHDTAQAVLRALGDSR
jgi:shikimate dehydrogenase